MQCGLSLAMFVGAGHSRELSASNGFQSAEGGLVLPLIIEMEVIDENNSPLLAEKIPHPNNH
jgi:protocatechuate 3,4-dioxygenase beta subunit